MSRPPPPRAATWRLRRVFAPGLAAVDGLCGDVRNRLKPATPDADCFTVELLLREALVNAVEHGCAGRAGGQVQCEVRRNARSIRIVVEDDGPGFDWRTRLKVRARTTATSGRGVQLYGVYADRVLFNDRGNRVVLHRRLAASSEEIDDDRSSIPPRRRPRGGHTRR